MSTGELLLVLFVVLVALVIMCIASKNRGNGGEYRSWEDRWDHASISERESMMEADGMLSLSVFRRMAERINRDKGNQ